MYEQGVLELLWNDDSQIEPISYTRPMSAMIACCLACRVYSQSAPFPSYISNETRRLTNCGLWAR